MARVRGVGRALPEHVYDQDTLIAALREQWAGRHHNLDRLERLHRAVQVGSRHLALPLEAYAELKGFGDANDAWIRVGLELAERATRDALRRAELDPAELGAIFMVSVTGIATPSLDARLLNRMPELPRDLRRLPLFGLGCVAGAAGVARASDFVRAWPQKAALVLSVELCSLTLQRGDLSVPNLIASGLFGDGAAAAVVAGAELGGRGPQLLATRACFYDHTEGVMGWEISERGFGIVLDRSVPEMVRRHLRHDVDAFLADQGLCRDDLGVWVCHPGGPAVLDAFEQALELAPEALARTRHSLASLGNLSSASVLMVLRDTMDQVAPGTLGLMLAMGPGFCSELVLLRW